MKSNRGFTLVELLVTIAILSIVLTTVTSVMLTGSKQFTKGSADANMQRQAQLVVNQIEDMLIDTNGGVFYTDYTNTREFVLYNATKVSGTVVYTKEVITWVAADEKLTYSKYNVDYDSANQVYTVSGAAIYADQLLAEDISDFKIDLSDTKKELDKDGNEIDIVQSVQITVGCTGNDGLVSYATSPIITLRNRMILSNSPENVFPNTPVEDDTMSIYIADSATATPVPVQYPGTTVEKGKTYNLYAMINDSYDVNTLVDWEIVEAGTLSVIDDETGVLTVNAAEPNMSLTIVAFYEDNPSKKATAVVQVAGGKEIVSVQIIPTSMTPFEPKYDSNVVLDGFSEADKSTLVYKWEVSEPTWVNTFTDHLSKLSLPVIQDANRKNLQIVIKLTVSAPGCQSKWTTVTYTIPEVGITKDSYIERGKYSIEYNYAVTPPASTADPKYTIYFCDESGNRKSEYDDLIDDVVIMGSSWAGGFVMQIADGLPVNTPFYLKVIMHCIENGVPKDHERIFYIPAVELFGQNTETAWLGFNNNHAGLDYKLYGQYSVGWDTSKYSIEVQEVVSNAPSGVNIIPHIGNSYIMDAENNLMRSEVSFELSGDTSGIDTSTIKVHSIRVKIQLKNEEIFTYSTLTFTE